MIGPLSGMQNMQGMQGMQNLQGLNNLTGNQGNDKINGLNSINEMGYDNINKLDDFMETEGIQDFSPVEGGVEKAGDPELQADLQGLIEKNQDFDRTFGVGSEVTPGDIANKFSNVLGNYINNVNTQNRDAEKAIETFAAGGDIDLHSVMIASEKANLSMQLALQMKNKIIQAYQEISRIQI